MKLNFKAPEIGDKSAFEKALFETDTNSFSKVFGSYFLWAENHKTKICFDNDILYIKYDKENPLYEMPKSAKTDEKLKESVDFLLERYGTLNKNSKFKLTRLLKNEADKLENLFPDKFEITPERNDFEYTYSIQELANLKGKKYHGKRGHIAKFSKMYEWVYRPLSIAKKEDYVAFFKSWFEEKPSANPNEMKAIEKALNYYNDLSLYGGAIYVSDKIVACAIGERINKDTFVVHFEKAINEFADAYTVINHELCTSLQDKYKFINREEDLGIPGLRKAKLSYHPYSFVEKYSAVLK